MSNGVQGSIIANVDLSESFTQIAFNYLDLYKDPKILFCVVLAFVAAQFVHVILRAYAPSWRRVTVFVYCCLTHLVVGALSAWRIMSAHPDIEFFFYFIGINSLVLYYVLLWLSTSWFKMPKLAKFLTLRQTKVVVDEKGQVEIEFGETVKFLAPVTPKKD